MYYALAALADILLGSQFSASKIYEEKKGKNLSSSLIFTFLSALITALLFIIINGGIRITLFSGICALLVGICYCSYMMLSFKIIARQGVSLYTMFLMLGSLFLPYLTGIIFLSEEIVFSRILGLILLIAAILLPGIKKSADKRTYILCIGVFILNGLIGVITKLHGYIDLPKIMPRELIVLTNAASVAVSGIIILCDCIAKKQKPDMSQTPISFAAIAVYAVCNGVSYMLQLICAANLPATVIFPLITGGSVLVTGLFEFLIFKKKHSKKELTAFVAALAGTLMFLF